MLFSLLSLFPFKSARARLLAALLYSFYLPPLLIKIEVALGEYVRCQRYDLFGLTLNGRGIFQDW